MKINSESQKAFNALESPIDIKIRNMSAPVFHNKLKELGYLTETGVLTQERELDFLSDRKVITIRNKKELDYSIVSTAVPYYQAYQKLLSKRSDWLFFEEQRMKSQSEQIINK